MSPRRRADGSPAPRSRRTAKPDPTAAALAELEALTDALPVELGHYRQLLTPKRRYYLEEALRHRTRTLAAVLYGVHDPHNQAAVMRTCEALGIQEVHVIPAAGTAFEPSERVTQNAHRWLDLAFYPDFGAAAAALRNRQFSLLAASLGPGSATLWDLDFTGRVAILLGGEADGLPAEVVAACDGAFAIPLYGLTQSFNISVAAAVTFAWAVESRRRAWGTPGNLEQAELQSLRHRFYATAARGRGEPGDGDE